MGFVEVAVNSGLPHRDAFSYAEPEGVTLQVGDDTVTATPRALRDVWYGQYVILWQTPPDYHGNIKSGDTHPTVGWLRVQLSGLTGVSLDSSEPDHFDRNLETAVREFQNAEGLLTDGIVGPATWIRVANRLNLPAPNLDG